MPLGVVIVIFYNYDRRLSSPMVLPYLREGYCLDLNGLARGSSNS